MKDEKEFAKAAGHQGHGGSVDKVLQIMEKEKIPFAEAARRPRGMVVGSPTTIPDHMQEMFEVGELSRRAFLQRLAAVGIAAPAASQLLVAGDVAMAQSRSSYKPTRRGVAAVKNRLMVYLTGWDSNTWDLGSWYIDA